jgi:uncharacterized protein (TIGR02246 family)
MTTVNSSATGETTAVRAVLDRLYAAWAAGDADALVAEYTLDATSTLPHAFHAGRDSIRERMAAGFTGPLRGSEVLAEVRDVRLLGADAAVVTSRDAVLMAGETDVPDDRWVLATWTLTRRNGRWLIAAYHNCPA